MRQRTAWFWGVVVVCVLILGCDADQGADAGGSDEEQAAKVTRYEAYSRGGGPNCGQDSLGIHVQCEPRSTCTSRETNTCEDKGNVYQAYPRAGGPNCGQDSLGTHVQCEPRSTCLDADANRCGWVLD
jgi:hypothetical protein